MLRSHSAVYKKTNNKVAIATIIFNRVIAPEGEILCFAPPKESIQRKGGSIIAYLRSYLRSGSMPGLFWLCKRV